MWAHHTILYHATMNLCYTCTVYVTYHYHTRSPYMYACVFLSACMFVGLGLLLNGAIGGAFIYLIVGVVITVIILLICLQWYKYVYKSYNNRSLKIVPLNINDRPALPLPLPLPALPLPLPDPPQARPLTPREPRQSKPMVVKKPVFELI